MKHARLVAFAIAFARPMVSGPRNAFATALLRPLQATGTVETAFSPSEDAEAIVTTHQRPK
jgi:hypothetical protein